MNREPIIPRVFPYKIAIRKNLAIWAFCGFSVWAMINEALSTSSVYLWALACGGLVFLAMFAFELFAAVFIPRYVTLTPELLIGPRYVFSLRPAVVRINSVTNVLISGAAKQRILLLYFPGGKMSIVESHLPSPSCFDEILCAIKSANK
jgi:hypothetical protein